MMKKLTPEREEQIWNLYEEDRLDGHSDLVLELLNEIQRLREEELAKHYSYRPCPY